MILLFTITHAVAADSQVNRIVSTAPSNTEILFALGLGNEVVGVSSYCDYPREVPERVSEGNLSVVGGFSTIDIEKIVDLDPDIVFATGGVQDQAVETLEGLGITVEVLDAENIDDVLENINRVGDLTGKSELARQLVRGMEQRIEKVTDGVARYDKPKTFYLIWHDPLMSAGPGTFINDVIQQAGGINLAGDSGSQYPIYNLEVLIDQDPEVIIVNLAHGGGGPTAEWVRNQELWQQMTAVKNNRVYEIDANIMNRPSPRIVDGLDQVVIYIHPEFHLKKKKSKSIRISVKPSEPQANEGVTVDVFDEKTSKRVKDVVIEVRDGRLEKLFTVEADEDGEIKLDLKEPGEYRLLVMARGYRHKQMTLTIEKEKTTTSSSSTTTTIVVTTSLTSTTTKLAHFTDIDEETTTLTPETTTLTTTSSIEKETTENPVGEISGNVVAENPGKEPSSTNIIIIAAVLLGALIYARMR